MTERGSRRAAARTSLCLLAALVLSCATSGSGRSLPQPEPLPPDLAFGESVEDAENIMLKNRLKQLMEQKHRMAEQEHDISEEQIEIQAILEAKAREREHMMLMELPPPDYAVGESQPQPLPKPEPFIHEPQHSSKRQGMNTVSYMSLCHFKICNLGRKRQSK